MATIYTAELDSASLNDNKTPPRCFDILVSQTDSNDEIVWYSVDDFTYNDKNDAPLHFVVVVGVANRHQGFIVTVSIRGRTHIANYWNTMAIVAGTRVGFHTNGKKLKASACWTKNKASTRFHQVGRYAAGPTSILIDRSVVAPLSTLDIHDLRSPMIIQLSPAVLRNITITKEDEFKPRLELQQIKRITAGASGTKMAKNSVEKDEIAALQEQNRTLVANTTILQARLQNEIAALQEKNKTLRLNARLQNALKKNNADKQDESSSEQHDESSSESSFEAEYINDKLTLQLYDDTTGLEQSEDPG